jgi:hypothetical protein
MGEGGLDVARSDRVEPNTGAGPIRRRRNTPNPPGDSKFRGGVRARSAKLIRESPRELLVAVKKRFHQLIVDVGRRRRSVGADGDGRTCGASQRWEQRFKQYHGAEVVHRDHQRPRSVGKSGHPGERHDPADLPICDGGDDDVPADRCSQIGVDVSRGEVDAEHSIALPSKPCCSRGTHAGCRSGDNDGHDNQVAMVMRRSSPGCVRRTPSQGR